MHHLLYWQRLAQSLLPLEGREVSAFEPHAAFLSLTSETSPNSSLQSSGPPVMNCMNAS